MIASEQGYILSAEAYPCDDQFVAFDLVYSESAEELNSNRYRMRRFHVRKDIAQALAKNITDILAAPDPETAWESVGDDPIELCDRTFDPEQNKHE
jgi:hypothetical protein